MTKTKMINELTKWAQKEMIDFITPIEAKTHIGLIGERVAIDNALPFDIKVMAEALYSMPQEARKSIVDSYLLRPWKSGIITRYPECFSEGEIHFAKKFLEVMEMEEDSPEGRILV